MLDLGHWKLREGVSIVDNPYGFVYEITNTHTNKKYIGKKQILTKRKRPPLKGKKNKRIEIVETDWKSYTSSSNELNKDIQDLGITKFKFEIIRFCENKSQLAYFEAKEQFDKDALLREDYYNGIINLRVGKVKI
jgi:hypothetical protein